MPWKNGRGTTRELALWPDGATFEREDWDWRVSAASVQADGPFSSFPGCERILVVTRGAGLRLAHEGADARAARLRPLEPYRFSGDGRTSAELVAGPVEDFNVIARRGRARAEAQALRLGARRARETLAAGHAFLHVLAGACVARVTGEEDAFELGTGDSLWLRALRGGEELELAGLEPEGVVLIATIAPAAAA